MKKMVVLLSLFLFCLGCNDSRYDRNNITKMFYPQNSADLKIDPTRETRCDLNTLFGVNGTWFLLDKRQKLLKKIAVAEGSTIVIQRDFPSGKHSVLLKAKVLDGKELVVSLTIINGIKENNIRAQFEQDERK